jgi:hypothetical protein
MTTFTSALSLLVLLLATGCFTLPVIQDKISGSTISPLNDFTTSKTNVNEVVSFHMRLVPDEETSDLPELPAERSLTNEFFTPTSTFANIPTSKDHFFRASREFDDLHLSEPFLFTTEHSFHERGDYEPILPNIESNTGATEHERRSVTMEDESESESDKRDFLELTTSYMPSFTSTSSAVAPKLYTSELTTEKYIGHLKDEPQVEKVKGSKTFTKPEVHSEEDSKESTIPMAQLDQKTSDRVYNVPSGVMHLELNNEVVTAIPEIFSPATMINKKEEELVAKPELEPKRVPEPEPEPELKPKPARKPKFEREDKQGLKREDKDETKRDDKDETKRDDKDETKREDKDETKLEDKPETKREGKEPSFPEEAKPNI